MSKSETVVDGMHAGDFPVLVVLEIHDALCAISGLHEAHILGKTNNNGSCWIKDT